MNVKCCNCTGWRVETRTALRSQQSAVTVSRKVAVTLMDFFLTFICPSPSRTGNLAPWAQVAVMSSHRWDVHRPPDVIGCEFQNVPASVVEPSHLHSRSFLPPHGLFMARLADTQSSYYPNASEKLTFETFICIRRAAADVTFSPEPWKTHFPAVHYWNVAVMPQQLSQNHQQLLSGKMRSCTFKSLQPEFFSSGKTYWEKSLYSFRTDVASDLMKTPLW